MRRSYRCVFFFLTLLFIFLQTVGCGGSSAIPLSVTTSSLPDGTVGSPYSASLTAAGGSPNYTWSQVSGGDMPGGVVLASTGIFTGTPTAAGSFGPYVFNVTDSTGAVVNSAGLSIKITTSALKVTTSTLPSGIINSAYSVTLAAAGGTPPYTWSETSGGALPPGISHITSAGVIAGTPTTPGTYGPYVFTVTDSTNATAASASLTLTTAVATCSSLGNEGALTSASPYAFLLQGTDASGNPIDIAGSFTPNGAGGITNATVDYNGFSNGPAQLQVNLAASSYSFGTSTFGCLSLAFNGPAAAAAGATRKGATPKVAHGALLRTHNTKAFAAAAASTATSVQFAFSLSGFDGTLYHTGRIIESDFIGSGTSASGFLHLQDSTAFSLASLQPNYALGVDGWTAESSGVSRTAIAGTFANFSGALSSGYADLNTGGTPSGELTGGTGTLSSTIDPNTGRGTGSYTIPTGSGNLTFDFAFYVLNASHFVLLSTDSPITVGSAPLLCGRALSSSAAFAPDPLNGYYLLATQGLQVNGSALRNLAEIGTLNATSAGTIPIATLYVNDAGTYGRTTYSNGNYTVEAASGRVAITGITATPPVVYLTSGNSSDDQIAGFLVGSDPQATSGVLVSQSTTAPAFLLTSVSGNYAMSTQEDLDAANGTALGAFTFLGAGQYLATQQTTGTVPNLPSTGLNTINLDGSGNLNGGNFPLVTNGQTIFAIVSSGDPLLYVFTAGTLPAP